MDAQKAASERDEQIEDKLMALAEIDGLKWTSLKKEQRLQNHIRSLELRLQNASSANSDHSSNDGESDKKMNKKQQKTYERYARAESSRKALVYQKKYLLMTIGGIQNTEQVTLATLSKIGGFKNPGDEKAPLSPKRRFIAAVNAIRAVTRLAPALFTYFSNFF